MSLPDAEKLTPEYEKQLPIDGKEAFKEIEVESAHDSDDNFGVLRTERDIATHIVSVHDDPTLNPWTLRAFIVGLGLSAFGGVLGKLAFAQVSSSYDLPLNRLNSGNLLLQTSMSFNCFLAAN